MNDARPDSQTAPADPVAPDGPAAPEEHEEHEEPAAEPRHEPAAEPRHEPAGPAPLGVPRTPTGNAEVDAHLQRLADADHLTTDGHLEVYEDVHRGLRDALTALDTRPGPVPPAAHPAGAPHPGPVGRPAIPTNHRQGS
ncbi:hypothetical protein GCM10009535_58760 [Streptomyces thermocarboxydovorans]|uniref:Uncharacterized protein n=1 Tax=Streptomyces thermocarboxydovorans TaxID=59298 RepID=A0ABP3SZU7_9ACTN